MGEGPEFRLLSGGKSVEKKGVKIYNTHFQKKSRSVCEMVRRCMSAAFVNNREQRNH